MIEFDSFKQRIQDFCTNHDYSERHYSLVSLWLTTFLEHYKKEYDFLDSTDKESLLESRFSLLENLNDIKLYTITEILNDPNNYFYGKIEEKKDIYKNVPMPYSFRKENGKYFIDFDSNAKFGLNVTGVYNFDTRTIEMIQATPLMSTLIFAHELEHSAQHFWYNANNPFHQEIKTMIREGDAIYHEKLWIGEILPKEMDWNEENIQIYTYPFYYQIYSLLMLCLPKEMRDFWKAKYFKVQFLNAQERKQLVDIMALATLLVAKIDINHTKNVILQSIEVCQSDCKFLIKLNEGEKENLEFGIQLTDRMKEYTLNDLNVSELFATFVIKTKEVIERKGYTNEVIGEFLDVVTNQNEVTR